MYLQVVPDTLSKQLCLIELQSVWLNRLAAGTLLALMINLMETDFYLYDASLSRSSEQVITGVVVFYTLHSYFFLVILFGSDLQVKEHRSTFGNFCPLLLNSL